MFFYFISDPRLSNFGWSLESGSARSNYICEIARTDVQLLDFTDRDYGNVLTLWF